MNGIYAVAWYVGALVLLDKGDGWGFVLCLSASALHVWAAIIGRAKPGEDAA